MEEWRGQLVDQFWSSTRLAAAFRSAATISLTRELKSTRRFQPKRRSALAGFPSKRLRTFVSQKISKTNLKYVLYFGWSEIGGVDFNDNFTITDVDRVFVYTFPFPSEDQ